MQTFVFLLALAAVAPCVARAQQQPAGELVDAGQAFLGGDPRALTAIIQRAVSQWGQPNGYVLGEETGDALSTLRYGEGSLHTRNAGDLKVYWQTPAPGLDADRGRTMMLVYNLPSTEAIYQHFVGIDGSAYLIGTFGMVALEANRTVIVVIRATTVRLGANVGYLDFTRQATRP